MASVENSREGDVFRVMIAEVAVPHLDPKCGRIPMVTSFNEWYDDTQIKATGSTASQKGLIADNRGAAYNGLMTPRERIRAMPNHREPHRVPVDLSGYRFFGVAAMARPKLRESLGLEPKPACVYAVIRQPASVDEAVLDCLIVEQVQNVLVNVPAENIVVMLDAVNTPR